MGCDDGGLGLAAEAGKFSARMKRTGCDNEELELP